MAQNDFKSFAVGAGANVTSQADWEALPALVTGFQSGKASSAQINKAIRQASFIAAALAQYTSDNTGDDVLDDGDQAAFITKMAAAFGKDFQPLDATLTALATLTGAADKLPYFNGDDTAALTVLTAFAREILAQTDAAGVLSKLGLGIRGFSTFTASGLWTCPEGVTTVYIDACGGGGGGAYSSPGATGGGGGGGAAGVIGASISVTPGTTYTVTIGGPGAAGTSSSVNGMAGGATSFGSLLVLNGGGGGLSSAGAGAGGGTGGNAGTAGALNGGVSFGGSGGGCVLGNGGAGGSGAMFGTIPGQYGGGGGGGANGGSGARGAYGILKLRW